MLDSELARWFICTLQLQRLPEGTAAAERLRHRGAERRCAVRASAGNPLIGGIDRRTSSASELAGSILSDSCRHELVPMVVVQMKCMPRRRFHALSRMLKREAPRRTVRPPFSEDESVSWADPKPSRETSRHAPLRLAEHAVPPRRR